MKKLLVILTIILSIGWGLLLINPATIDKSSLFLIEKIELSSNALSNSLGLYQQTRTFIELGMILGSMLLGGLWTAFLLRKTAKK